MSKYRNIDHKFYCVRSDYKLALIEAKDMAEYMKCHIVIIIRFYPSGHEYHIKPMREVLVLTKDVIKIVKYKKPKRKITRHERKKSK